MRAAAQQLLQVHPWLAAVPARAGLSVVLEPLQQAGLASRALHGYASIQQQCCSCIHGAGSSRWQHAAVQHTLQLPATAATPYAAANGRRLASTAFGVSWRGFDTGSAAQPVLQPYSRSIWTTPAQAAAPAAADDTSPSRSSSSSSSRQRALRRESEEAARQRRVALTDFKSVTLPDSFLIEHYRHPQPVITSMVEAGAFKSPSKLLAYLKRAFVLKASGYIAVWTAQSNILGYTAQDLRQEVADIYLQIQMAQAQMQPDLVRDLVSKEVFTKLRAQADTRRRLGWTEVILEVLDEGSLSKHTQRVLARRCKMFEKSPNTYLQFTFCITSKQRFAAYGTSPKTGEHRLLEGDPDKVLDVVEYCVFERKTRDRTTTGANLMGKAAPLEGSRWRLVAWLQP